MDHVSVSYGERAVLTGCSLSMNAGEHVALFVNDGEGSGRIMLKLLGSRRDVAAALLRIDHVETALCVLLAGELL